MALNQNFRKPETGKKEEEKKPQFSFADLFKTANQKATDYQNNWLSYIRAAMETTNKLNSPFTVNSTTTLSAPSTFAVQGMQKNAAKTPVLGDYVSILEQALAAYGRQRPMDVSKARKLGADISALDGTDAVGRTMREQVQWDRAAQASGEYDSPDYLTKESIAFPSNKFLKEQADKFTLEKEGRQTAAAEELAYIKNALGITDDAEAQRLWHAAVYDPESFAAEFRTADAAAGQNNPAQEITPAKMIFDLADMYSKNVDQGAIDYADAMLRLITGEQKRRETEGNIAKARMDPDFAIRSQYIDNYNGNYDERFQLRFNFFGAMPAAYREDDVYHYINNPEFRARYDNEALNTGAGSAQIGGNSSDLGMKGYAQLDDYQREHFNFLWNDEENPAAHEEAMAFLKSIEPSLMARRAKNQEEVLREVTQEAPAVGYVTAAGANLINAALGPTAMVATATGMADENNPLFDSVRATNIPRQELGQAAYDWGYENWGEFGGIIAQGAFNLSNVIVDQMALRTLGGIKSLGRTVNPNVAKTLVLALQGSQIATTTIQQELDEGASNEGAVLKGALAWGISAFVENMSLNAFMSNPSSAIKYALRNFVSGGAEEGLENVLNTLAGKIASFFTGDRDKLGRMYDDAITATKGDQKAAEELVVGNYLKELSGDVLLGALGEGIMGAPGAVEIAAGNHQTGTRVLENDAADQLLALAETMPEGSESRKVAENIRNRMKPVTKMEVEQAEAAPEAKQEAPVQQEQAEQAVSEMETTTEAKQDTAEAPAETAQNAPQEAVEEQTADNTQEAAQAPETKETPKKKGKRISPAKLGQLYRTLYNDLDAQGKQTVSGVMESSVKGRLAELGEDQASIDEVAAPLAKLLADDTLTNKEKQIITKSKNGLRVFNEIRFAEDDTYSSNWVAEAGTQKSAAAQAINETRSELDAMLAPKVLRPAVEAAQRTVAESGMAVANAKHGTDAKLGVQLTGEGGKTQDAEILQVTGVTKQGMQVKVKGSDGQTKTVDMADMKFANSDTATIAAYIQKAPHVFTAEEANKMMQTYMGGDVQEHISGFTTLYNAGYAGRAIPPSKLPQAQVIYDLGKQDAATDEANRLKGIGTGKRGTGRVTFAPGVIKEKIDKRQRMQEYAVRALAKAGSMNFVLFDSQTMTDGSLLDDYDMPVVNGTYNRKTNTMYIDLSSGKTNEDSSAPYAILRSVSHELTHFMEFNSAEGYAKLKNFVKSEYARKGKSWDKLVEDELKNAAMAMDRETRAAAEGEVIAKAMEMMLQDSKAIERLAQRDQSLYARMKKFIQEYFRKVREAFELIRATSTEAALLLEQDADGIMRYAEKLTKLWDDALVEAVENVQGMGETITADEAEAEMSETLRILSGLRDGDGNLSFSLKSMQEDYQTYKKMLVTAGATTDEIDDLFDTIDAVMKKVGENRTELDFGENIGRDDRSFLPVKPNSDPLYKVSLDFSSLCRKRLLQQAVQERLEAKYETVLTKAERVAIRQELLKLQQEGLKIEVACALCYVEAARLKSPAQIAKFMDNKRAQLVDFFSKNSDSYKKAIDAKVAEMTEKLGYEAGTPMAQMSKADKRKVQAEKKAMYTKYMPTEAEERIIRTAEDLPETMYKTSEGLWKLKREHPEIFAAYTTFVRNATKSKGIEGDTPFYAGDSQTISDGLIESMNAENGLRSQSWSDFQVIHVLDYMAAIIEFSTRNAKMQSYTKVPDFVKLMGNTGMMINLSLIPSDYDGKNLTFDPVEGMDYAVSKTLRDVYHGTVGNISIGISDPHIKALLASNDIDYVIPYHKSSMDKKTRAAIGLKKWEDYEASQNEKQRDYSETDKNSKQYRKAPKFSEWYNHEEAMAIAKAAQATAPSGDVAYGARVAMQEMAERYKQLCHERGLQEKFAQFASEENYWKLLIDRKMIDQVTGELIEQKAVKPVFNTADTLAILDAEVERFAPVKADFEKAASRIEEMWAKGEIRKAAKSKEIQKQVSDYEDTVVVRNIVESAAEMVGAYEKAGLTRINDDFSEHLVFSRREVTGQVNMWDYMAELDAQDATTGEERAAIENYKRVMGDLRQAIADRNQYKEALRNATTPSERGKALGSLQVATKRLDRAYDQLSTVMKNPAMKAIEQRSTAFVQEYLDGKTLQDVAELIDLEEAEIKRLAGKNEKEAQKHREIVRQLRSKATENLLKEREKFHNMMDRDRRVRDMNMKAAQHRKHLAAQVKKLDGLIRHETDYKHVPEELKPLVETFVGAFTEKGAGIVFNKQQADKLSSVYRKLLQTDGSMNQLGYLDGEYVMAKLDELNDLLEEELAVRSGKGMTMEERAANRLATMENLAEIADSVYGMVKNANELFYGGKKAQFASIGTEAMQAMEQRQDYRRLKGKAGENVEAVDNFMRAGNMTPVYFFDRLKNKVFKTLYGDMLAAQDEYAFRVEEARQFWQATKEKYHYDSWADDAALTMKTEKGKKLTLDKEDAMSVYATWKREHADELLPSYHLEDGGIVLEGNQMQDDDKKYLVAVRTTPTTLTQNDMAKIHAYLTEEQRAYADAVVEYMSTTMADYGNETSMELYGIKKYKESYYFPMKTAGDQQHKKSTAGGGQVTDDNRVKHRSFTKARVRGAATSVVIGKFSQVAAMHMEQMILYSTMTVPIESMNRVLNYKHQFEDGSKTTVRAMMEQKYGPVMKKYMETFLNDMNGGIRRDSREAGLNKLVSLFKRGSVLASASVAVQQPTAIARATAMISPKHLIATTVPHKGDYDELKQHSGVAILKSMGKFDVDMGVATAEWMLDADEGSYSMWQKVRQATNIKDFETFKKRWNAIFTWAPGKADEMTWAWLWRAVKAEQAEAHPEMNVNSDAFLDVCGERFNDIVNHTQVYDSTLVRSQNMRSKSGLMQSATSFMSEPTLTANMLYDAVTNKERGKQYAVRAVTAALVSQILTSLAQALVSAGRDEDEKKTWVEKYAGKAAGNLASNLNPMSMLPLLRDIQSLIDGYDVTRADMSIFTEIFKAFGKLDDENISPYRKAEDLGGSLAKLLGIPAKNIMRDLRSFTTTFFGNADRPTSGYAVGEAVKAELLPGYDTKADAYYQKLYDAMARGDQKEAETIREYLVTVLGKKESSINTGISTALKQDVLEGDVAKDEAIKWLMDNGLKDKQSEAYKTVDEWIDKAAHADEEGYSHSMYGDFLDSIPTGGKSMVAAAKELLANGVDKKTIATQIATRYKDQLIELNKQGKAADLLARLLSAYEAIGYDREYELNYIKKNWLKAK